MYLIHCNSSTKNVDENCFPNNTRIRMKEEFHHNTLDMLLLFHINCSLVKHMAEIANHFDLCKTIEI